MSKGRPWNLDKLFKLMKERYRYLFLIEALNETKHMADILLPAYESASNLGLHSGAAAYGW